MGLEIKEFILDENGMTIGYEGGGSAGTPFYKHSIDINDGTSTYPNMFEIISESSESLTDLTEFVTEFENFISMKLNHPGYGGTTMIVYYTYETTESGTNVHVKVIDNEHGTNELSLSVSALTITDTVTLL